MSPFFLFGGFSLEPVSGFVTDPNSFPVPRTYGQGGLSRRQTSAEVVVHLLPFAWKTLANIKILILQAWQQRQRINPQRAKTKKVKLTPQGPYCHLRSLDLQYLMIFYFFLHRQLYHRVPSSNCSKKCESFSWRRLVMYMLLGFKTARAYEVTVQMGDLPSSLTCDTQPPVVIPTTLRKRCSDLLFSKLRSMGD